MTRSLTGDLVTDELVPVAVQLVGAVRDADPDAVARALLSAREIADGCYEPAEALAVVLAAMVPDDCRPSDLFAWQWEPRGRPSVAAVLTGSAPWQALDRRGRAKVIAALVDRGLSSTEIAARIRCARRTVTKYRAQQLRETREGAHGRPAA